MKKNKTYKRGAFIAGLVMTLFMGSAGGSTILPFDEEADARILTEFFASPDERPDVERQYKTDTRRYVCFDVTAKCDDVYKSLLPLRTDSPLGQRVFHERTYEVVAQKGAGPSVFVDLQAEGVKLFVRSSPLKFDDEYWALYELLVPGPPNDSEVVEFTQHFFAIFYRQLKESISPD
tara:strand:+ start:2869 stop:3399 length:531 start_codon:yes stop_codon:yes gene_type:complete